MPNKTKKVRCNYDSKNLDQAVSAVNCGSMSIRIAEAHFNVPRSTLHDRISGKVGPSPSHGKQPVFPEHVERKLADKIQEAATMGFGIDRKQLQAKAAQLAKQLKIKTPFKNGVPGKDWVGGFVKRHNISLKCQTALSTVRGRMLNETATNKYFDDLKTVLTTLNIENKPSQVWNMDDTSLSLTHKPTKVYARKSTRNIPGRVGNSRESITITACVNAAGDAIPPMVIVKGKTKKALDAYNHSQGPISARYTYQEKGWMENSLGTEWFENLFLPNCGPERPQLLVLDSHCFHETLEILESAKKNGITVLALPPHTTQWLNPLDKTLFGPLYREYNKQCTQFMAESPNNIVSKWEFPRLFRSAYEISFNKHNIRKGFEACGIIPFNPKAMPKEALNPSIPFDNVKNLTPASPSGSVSIETSPTLMSPVNQIAEIVSVADGDGTMVIEAADAAEILQAIVDADINIDLEVDNLFELPSPDRPEKEANFNKRKLTSHRILTSDEVIEEKRQIKRMKEEQQRVKEEKKKEREEKKAAKFLLTKERKLKRENNNNKQPPKLI